MYGTQFTNNHYYQQPSAGIFGSSNHLSSSRQHLQLVSNTNSLAKLQPLTRPVQFKSVNLASSQQSANIRWASTADAVNFMDHLYFITNFALDYLLENELPQELMNQTLFSDPLAVLSEHRNELIKHFHRVLIAACTCLCIGISIPLFGFMIACCWCSGGSRRPSSKSRSTRPSSSARRTSRSRSQNRDSETDWLALTSRDSGHYRGPSGSSRHHRDLDHRRRHGRHHRRSGSVSNSVSGHHRSRSVPPSLRYESSCHPCLRTFFSTNLFMTLLLVSFFAVCAFVTNEYVNSGVKQLPRALNQSVDEVQTYLNNTGYEIDNLFRTNYNQLETEINHRLNTSGMIIKHKIAVSSEAIALTNLTDIVMEFNDTKVRLERLDRELSSLRSRLNTVKIGLLDFKRRFNNCTYEQCPILKRKYSNSENFRILPQFDKMPDVKPLIKKVTQLIDDGIVTQVQRGKDDFDRFATIIQREVDGAKSGITVQLQAVSQKLSNLATDVSQTIHWTDRLFNQTKASARRLNQYTEYEQYRHYACLTSASVILFILLCYTIGWLFGSCRPQLTVRTYKTRVKTSASASFPFSCGILTVFLLFLPMILAAIVLFLSGSVGDKIVCRVIKHPEQKQSKQIYAMLQNKFLNSNLPVESNPEVDKVTIEQVDGKSYKVYWPNYADIISRCHQNMSIYRVLKLDQYDKVYLTDDGRGAKLAIALDKSFGLGVTPEFKRIHNIDGKLRDMIKNIDIDTSRFTLLSMAADEILTKSMSLSFDDLEMSFARLYDSGMAITPIDMEQLIKDVNAQRAATSAADIEADLSIVAMLASSFQDQLLPNITSSLLNLKEGVRHLKLKMFHGRNSFSTVIQELLSKVKSAEKVLRTQGNSYLRISANEFVDELNSLIDQYANHAKTQVENVIGQCEPVSRALNSTTSTLCDEIILPFNGYWFSAIASLILILPATLLAYALKGLYSLARRTIPVHHSYSYAEPDDDISYDDDGDDVALAYQIGHHNHLSHKPSGSSALPSAPTAPEDNWSPSSANYVHNSRPPPYAV